MMKKILNITIGAALACALAVSPALGKSQSSMSRTDFFHEGVSARAFGVGGAFAAIVDDSGAAYWNPAGLFLMDEGQFHTTRSTKSDFDLTTQTLSLAMPALRGVAAMNLVYTSTGNFLLTTEDPLTGRLQPAGTMGESDTGASISYAWPTTKDLYLGATVKGVRHNIGPNNSDGFGFDLGAVYQYDYATRLSLGLQDIGNMRMGADNVPMNVRLGVARKFDGDRLSLGATYDFRYLGDEFFSVGAEYAIENTFFARMGSTNGKFSAGVGFNYDNYKIDYAFMNDKNAGDEQKLTVGYMINTSRKRMPKRTLKPKPGAMAEASGEPVILTPKRKEKPEETKQAPAKDDSDNGLKLKETKQETKTETKKAATNSKESTTEEKSPEEKAAAKKSAEPAETTEQKPAAKTTERRRSGSAEKTAPSGGKTANSEKASPSIEWEKPVDKPAEKKDEKTTATKAEPKKKEETAKKLSNRKTITARDQSGAGDQAGEAPATGSYTDPLSLPFGDYSAMKGIPENGITVESGPDEAATSTVPLDVPVDLNKNWWPEPKDDNEGQFGLDDK